MGMKCITVEHKCEKWSVNTSSFGVGGVVNACDYQNLLNSKRAQSHTWVYFCVCVCMCGGWGVDMSHIVESIKIEGESISQMLRAAFEEYRPDSIEKYRTSAPV